MQFNDQPYDPTTPEPNMSAVMSHTFEIYKKTLGYNIIAALIYAGALAIIFVATGFSASMIEIFKELQTSGNKDPQAISDLVSSQMQLSTTALMALAGALVSAPLAVGVIYLMHKSNTGQAFDFGDLFIGYKRNFINIFLFGLIFEAFKFLSEYLCCLPHIFLLPFLFLGFPILLFENATVMDALKKSFEIVKRNYIDFLVLNILAFICSRLGVIACCIGAFLTFAYYQATMYSAYCAYIGTPRNYK